MALPNSRDYPGYRLTRSVEAIFQPAGFDEGLTACLLTRDGHYAGAFHISTDDPRYPRDSDVAIVNRLRTALAALIDPTAAPRQLGALLAPDAAAFLINAEGNGVPLNGTELTRELLADGRLVASLRAATTGTERFRWRCGDKWWSVRLIPVGELAHGGQPAELVLARPQRLPHGLTARELEVLSLLAVGHSNAQIARALTISIRTAVHHVENIMAKLGQVSRAACGFHAVREGQLLLSSTSPHHKPALPAS